MTSRHVSEFETLYDEVWCRQTELLARADGANLLDCATPVLAFGDWMSARFATVGVNPSKWEFLDPSEPCTPLPPDRRRFLHRLRLASSLDAQTLSSARYLAEGYFSLGHAYDWFRPFEILLRELGFSYCNGTACHTDYVSPFATAKKIGEIRPVTYVSNTLRPEGLEWWRKMLNVMPNLEFVLGIGRGWKFVGKGLGIHESQWCQIPTPFDIPNKNVEPPWLLHGNTSINDRAVSVFWWKPYRSDALSWLADWKKPGLAGIMKGHTC